MNRDIVNNLLVAESLRPAVYGAAANGESVDLRGSDSAAIAVSIGAIVGTGGDASIGLEESDDGSTGWAAVDSGDIIGVLPAELEASTAHQFGYIGEKRYIRVTVDDGTETSVAASAVVVKCHLSRSPEGYSVTS